MGREHVVPPKAFELEAVPIPRMVSGVGIRSVLDDLTLDEEEKEYPLARDVAKEAPGNVN